jgi:hypothetical protein
MYCFSFLYIDLITPILSDYDNNNNNQVSWLNLTVMFSSFNTEVPGSYLGRDTDYLEIFRGLLQHLQGEIGSFLSCTFQFIIHYSTTIRRCTGCGTDSVLK